MSLDIGVVNGHLFAVAKKRSEMQKNVRDLDAMTTHIRSNSDSFDVTIRRTVDDSVPPLSKFLGYIDPPRRADDVMAMPRLSTRQRGVKVNGGRGRGRGRRC